MKSILFLIISAALVVSGYSQTRNVLVGTNNAVVQPTNFWSADATNARSGLGLGSAATNAVSAFQPASSVLTNLSASNGGSLTNLSVLNIIGTLGLGQGGTGSTNASSARTALGLGTAATNSSSAFQPSSVVLSNLASSNAGSLTNIAASNVTGTIAISNGGSGATTAGGARTNLGLGWSALTNTNAATSLLGLTTTNGQVVANTGTNFLTFTNNIWLSADGGLPLTFKIDDGITIQSDGETYIDSYFRFNQEIRFNSTNSAASTTRANLGFSTNLNVLWTSTNASNARSAVGLGATWLTNTNVTNFRTDIGLGWSALTNTNAGTGLVSVNTNGEVVSPTNFWQVAPIQTLVQDLTVVVTSQTNNATNARNLYVYSLATNVTGISNIIVLPTNAATFSGDEATVIHRGTTNTTTVIRQAGSTNNLITLSRFDEAVKFIRESGQWDFYHNISYVEPIYFSGTNATANAAASRTNLGLGTTNAVTFQSASVAGGVVVQEITLTPFGIDAAPWGGGQIDFEEMQFFGNGSNSWDFGGSGIYNAGAFAFANTTNAATTRTNLGIPLTALTNTNNANFQAAIFATNAAPTNTATPNTVNFTTAIHWMEVNVVTNGVTNNFRIPLFK